MRQLKHVLAVGKRWSSLQGTRWMVKGGRGVVEEVSRA